MDPLKVGKKKECAFFHANRKIELHVCVCLLSGWLAGWPAGRLVGWMVLLFLPHPSSSSWGKINSNRKIEHQSVSLSTHVWDIAFCEGAQFKRRFVHSTVPVSLKKNHDKNVNDITAFKTVVTLCLTIACHFVILFLLAISLDIIWHTLKWKPCPILCLSGCYLKRVWIFFSPHAWQKHESMPSQLSSQIWNFVDSTDCL